MPEDINAAEYRKALSTRLAFVERHIEVMSRQVAELEHARLTLTDEANHLRSLLGIGVNPANTREPEQWRSAADVVVEFLDEVGVPMHYREIERALRERGAISLGGKDPANALLARYFDDLRLRRVSRGTYVTAEKWIAKSTPSRKKRRA